MGGFDPQIVETARFGDLPEALARLKAAAKPWKPCRYPVGRQCSTLPLKFVL